MIIHTGMRTDIPAYYTPWLLRRLEEGYVLVRNPIDFHSVTRYTLSPEVVDLIAFCTKNPAPMLPYLDAIAEYGQYWFVTITPYGRDIERNVPPASQVIADFRRLAERVGRERVAWRYDPILLHGEYTIRRHMEEFARMAAALRGATDTCVISFVDLYDKVRRNFPELRAVAREERLLMAHAMADIARENGMILKSCGEGDELAAAQVDTSGCMTIAVYERALGRRLKVPKIKPARRECACYLSCDIGAYNTCGHLCRYCYANNDERAVCAAMTRHDPRSPFLIGHAMPGDRVHQAEQYSWLDNQISMMEVDGWT